MSNAPDKMPPDREKAASDTPYRERRLRRYHRAQARRRDAARADGRFYSAVFSLAGIGAALAIGLAVMALSGGPATMPAMGGWVTPWLGPLSRLDVLSLVIIGGLAALYLWRTRRR